MEYVEVNFAPAGQPLHIRRDGRTWHVGAEPIRWYERTRWWEDTTFRTPKNTDVRIDYTVWRVQVRLGHNPRSELITWDLIENPQNETWSVHTNQEKQIAS